MKHVKKMMSFLLALVMVFAMAIPVLAQEVSVGTGKGSITISNAAKGETYTIYKLFDATVAENGGITYTGNIPEALTTYFTESNDGYISASAGAYKDVDADVKEMSDGLRNALSAWVKTGESTAQASSDGSALTFKDLPYGYYVVTTTQGEQAITVTSTNPSATIIDKNSSSPTNLKKTVDKNDINIGDTVTYTVSFKTTNYYGTDEGGEKKIISYTIHDTLPVFLEDVRVTSVIVDNDGKLDTENDQTKLENLSFNQEKKIEIPWYENGKFLYNNGATVFITYTATVTNEAAIAGSGNTNKVTLTWKLDDGSTNQLEDDETIYTYAFALKKVDDKGYPLADAKFELPFYVQESVDTDDDAYIYAGTTEKDGLTNTLVTPQDGEITIKGVKSGTYSIKEVKAPDGYNMLTVPIEVTATKTSETKTKTTFYLDENGNVVSGATSTSVTYINDKIAATAVLVVNKSGTELPSTGGTGTTMFYIIGGILVVGALVLLIAKRRMKGEE